MYPFTSLAAALEAPQPWLQPYVPLMERVQRAGVSAPNGRRVPACIREPPSLPAPATTMTPAALAQLTPLDRDIFLLRESAGLDYDEIAAAMNCSSGTIKKGVSRAIGKLRAKLSQLSELARLVDVLDELVRFAARTRRW